MKIQVTRKQVSNAVFLLILCAAWFLIGWLVRDRLLGPEVVLVEQARQALLSESPVDLPTNRELTYAAIRGLLKRIDDPYAVLFEPEVSRRYFDDLAGESGIVGMAAEIQNGEMVIVAVYPGFAAEQAGLKPGDVIQSVDGIDFDATTTETEASILIRGPIGSAAHFVVRRDDQTLNFEPVRQERAFTATRMLDGDVGYLAQYVFTKNAPEKVKTALQELLAQHPKALIWDLRANSGGAMDATQQVLSYFVKDGVLFTAELKGGKQQPFMASGEVIAPDIPLVVLIDKPTYSSAETAAATIRERDRGMLIGGTTHGKGMIQTTVPLLDGNMLHFSIAKWLSPKGQWYEGRGVSPDYAVSDDPNTEADEVLEFAVEFLSEKAAP
jgi:carboxyl-terminal processing protease